MDSPPPIPPPPRGLYRAQDLLAASHLASFPKVCVKTNQPAEHSIACRFAWPWERVIWRGVLAMTLLFSAAGIGPAIVFGLIIAAIVFAMKQGLGHKLYVPLSDEAWRREQRMVLTFMIADVFMFAALPFAPFFPPAIIFVVVCFVVSSCLAQYMVSPLKMVRADARYVYLRGAHPDFLAALPELHFPAQRRGLGDGGAWRWHEMLVVRSGMPLPDRCVVTNQPAAKRIAVRAIWPNAIVVAILLYSVVCLNVCGLFLVVIAYISSKRVNLRIPLSDEAFRKRQRAILTYLTAMVCALVLVPVTARIEPGALIIYGFIWTLLAAVSWEAWVGLPIKIDRVDGEYIFFTGVHRDYLDALPEY